MIFNTPINQQFSEAPTSTAPELDRNDSRLVLPPVLNSTIEVSQPLRDSGWPQDIGGSAILSGVVTAQQVGAGTQQVNVWTNIPAGVYTLEFCMTGEWSNTGMTQPPVRLMLSYNGLLHPIAHVLWYPTAASAYTLDSKRRIVLSQSFGIALWVVSVAACTVNVTVDLMLHKHL